MPSFKRKSNISQSTVSIADEFNKTFLKKCITFFWMLKALSHHCILDNLWKFCHNQITHIGYLFNLIVRIKACICEDCFHLSVIFSVSCVRPQLRPCTPDPCVSSPGVFNCLLINSPLYSASCLHSCRFIVCPHISLYLYSPSSSVFSVSKFIN